MSTWGLPIEYDPQEAVIRRYQLDYLAHQTAIQAHRAVGELEDAESHEAALEILTDAWRAEAVTPQR